MRDRRMISNIPSILYTMRNLNIWDYIFPRILKYKNAGPTLEIIHSIHTILMHE